MKNFYEWMLRSQLAWRKANVSTTEQGVQNKRKYPHILPARAWEESLWPGIRKEHANSLASYLAKGIQHHTGVHNLLSSWVACANFYFPFRNSPEDLGLVAAFMRSAVDSRIDQVTGVELEWADDGEFSPARLLGESDGRRGSGQTSPDVAFLVRAKIDGRREAGVVLVESKLTEESFYPCSARTKTRKDGRAPNPRPERCSDIALLLKDPSRACHQATWGRNYWNHLTLAAESFGRLKRCPAASAGYQLLRQQALANGLRSGKYPFVASCVAHDERNEKLLGCMKGTGLSDLSAFGTLFSNAVPLTLFTHQAWWRHIRANGGTKWAKWVEWTRRRYQFE